MKDLTEETLRSDCLVNGKLLKVFRDEVRRPDGGETYREWIKHPGAAAVVAQLPDRRTLLVRQFRYPSRREFLELPAGKLDSPDEDPCEVARRELEEETGWIARELTLIGKSYPCIGYSDEVIYFYLGRDLTEGEQNLGDSEFLEVINVNLDDAIAMARRGEIQDMKTAVGLLYAAEYLLAPNEDEFKKDR